MELKTVDLYQYFGLPKSDNMAGILTCYIQKTDMEISSKRLHPAMLILPGGGYEHVSAREGEPVALRLLPAGFSAFVLRYSVANVRFPVALREAAMAMRYIRENAAEFQVDPAHVAAMGFSAGGHLCGTLGMLYECPEIADIGSAQLLRPDALVLCYPVAVSWGATHEGSFMNLCGDDLVLRQRLSLDRLVREDMPRVFLWHTRPDDCVPCRNSLILANALAEKNIDFVLHVYHQGCHGLSTADSQVYPVGQVPSRSENITGWIETMLQFLKELDFVSRDGV